MNSPHQREQLPDLLSDALNDAERARVESHLKQCAQCARELRALESVQQTVASLTVATPPESVRVGVRAALREDKKQFWTLSAFLAKRAQERHRARAASARWRPKNSERIGARKALPFALPARQLAWGGAVALGAVGLMLLARPSLQNDSMSKSAPVGETELAARAAADATSGAAGATDNSATATTNDAAATNAGKASGTKAPLSKTDQNAKSSPFPAALAPATGGASSAPGSSAQMPPLPPLPPPPPRTPQTHPEDLAPIPKMQTPSFDLFPNVAPAPNIAPDSTRKSSESKPQKRPNAPASPPKSVPPTKVPPARVVVPKQEPVTPNPSTQNEAPPAPAPPSTADAENLNSSADNSYAPDRASEDAPSAFAPSGPPSRINRAAPAPATRSLAADSSENWTGGEVSANLRRGGNQVPVLTISVTKAIGNARLFLLLPDGETLVWRGSMNAAPVEIKLPKLAAQLRGGQKIRARLEQTDSSGNPKGKTTFNLLWP